MLRAAYTSYIGTGHLFKWGLALLWLVGCQRDVSVPSPLKPHALQPGRFLVVLQGAVTDTLEGTARFRQDTSGVVVVDLSGQPDNRRGLSLEWSSAQADTLEAVRRWIAGPSSSAFVVGYLDWPPYTFVTEAGSLVLIERSRTDRVVATFRLALGALDRRTGEPLEVEAIGSFIAIPVSEK
ncbi:hypothetical protein [Rhodothermus profundi]|uniref:Uncharacterized protein n=1 Tax=Rhodothermus profundi TaxID=633813 RepID=A0A1M6XLJ9_9BACT|nr:hypothetical protein [Rhodothermus profundi]SHL06847.1 hypothetical protein SAMN04488087_2648 [Rhodothermus profundi]